MSGPRAGGPLPVLPAGVYRHYKGHLYLVLGYAQDALDDRIQVVYIGLDLAGLPSPMRMRTREVGDFFACVDPATGDTLPEVDDRSVPRFRYTGPTVDTGDRP